MKADIYNQKGEKTGQAELPKEIFDVKVVPDLLHQVIVSQMANRRQGTAHTKDRGDVRGGGRKPWRQKGTGRARHGSRRSPIWKGGGVAFGPTKDKVYERKIPKSLRRKAVLMALSAKAQNQLLILLDNLKFPAKKTKEVAQALKNLPCKGQTVLIASPVYDADLLRAAQNIPQVAVAQVDDFNALDLLSSKYLIMSGEGVKALEKMLKKS
ncbi:MAG: 50S ribosomal protein L4 [Candidatus Pacebacteria bacterium]|nr:50S ribosomal protein L4 [Candidatus Paceibacterota bacterium]